MQGILLHRIKTAKCIPITNKLQTDHHSVRKHDDLSGYERTMVNLTLELDHSANQVSCDQQSAINHGLMVKITVHPHSLVARPLVVLGPRPLCYS